MGTLYIVATPIGNLKDSSTRMIEVLGEVDLVLAEDTRVVQKLLNNFDIQTQVESYHQHTGEEKKLYILKKLIDGMTIALVSDAGTPGISDPGNELIDFLLDYEKTIKIVPIPGPSAVSSALSVCGFNVNEYLFLGFWPKKKAKKTLDLVKDIKLPFVFFDSPYRVIKNLLTIEKTIGSHTRVFIGRELTKLHETQYRGNIDQVISLLRSEKHLKGEIVVVVE